MECVHGVLSECLKYWETTVGAWTCISMQLNSKARIGFDNSTDVQRLCSCSPYSPVLVMWEWWSPSSALFNAGIETVAGFTARTLNANYIFKCSSWKKY